MRHSVWTWMTLCAAMMPAFVTLAADEKEEKGERTRETRERGEKGERGERGEREGRERGEGGRGSGGLATMPKKLIEEGWIMLFDGATDFGWKKEGKVEIENSVLELDGEGGPASIKTTTTFGDFSLMIIARVEGKGAEIVLNGKPYPLVNDARNRVILQISVESRNGQHTLTTLLPKTGPKPITGPGASHTPIEFRVPAGGELAFRAIRLKPLALNSIFNGKDLTGWKPVGGDACPKCKSAFTVTPEGELNVKDGPGDLQTEAQYSNFVLQLDVISHGEHLNSGIFFRSLPGQFWQGYEAQIRNQWEGDDRTKPVDIGTGGIYNRQKTRKVIPSDKEWFTYTVIADGPHVAAWVNGYQTADYVDEQADAPTARKGRYLGKGSISIQGHDPTTNLSFRNLRAAELPEAKK